jgi:LDH2 family malate/lactate/ureidoglycolate dehydrogenase
VIWVKTEAGRVEMQARALVKDRARRNLLLLIDGAKSDAMLLGGLAGVTIADFDALRELGLIEPVAEPSGSRASRPGAAPVATPAPAAPAAPLDYAQFTAALTQMISTELGLRGFVLTLAVEKAGTIEELQDVANRTLAQIAERKGEARAAAARRVLYGG